MATHDKTATRTLGRRWEDYQPPKSTLFWAFAVGVVATLVVGFNWGGWVTGGTSRALVAEANKTAFGDLAAAVCVERFNAASDSAARLAELSALDNSYARRQFIEAGGWATMPGATAPDRGGAEGCATALTKA